MSNPDMVPTKHQDSLERVLWEAPELRAALRDGRLSYEKTRTLARVVNLGCVQEQIEWAQEHTVLELRAEVDRDLGRQMFDGPVVQVKAPQEVMRTVARAVLTAKAVAKAAGDVWEAHLGDSEDWARVCDHFVSVWKGKVRSWGTAPH